HPYIGRDRDLRPAPECVAVQCGDDRRRKVRELVTERPHAPCHGGCLLLGSQRTELLEVPAGNERLVSLAPNDQAQCALGAGNCLLELVHRLRCDGVARMGPIDGDDGQPFIEFKLNHSRSPSQGWVRGETSISDFKCDMSKPATVQLCQRPSTFPEPCESGPCASCATAS